MNKKLLKIFLWTLNLSVVCFLGWLLLMPEMPVETQVRSADGEGIVSLRFTPDKKDIKIRAVRQRNAENGNYYLDGFQAEIESNQGDLFHVYADQAYIFNHGHNSELERNVRIESESLHLTGEYLLLKDLYFLASQKEMAFVVKQTSGTARKGISYNMKDEVIKLFDVSGVMDWQGVPHQFQCEELTISRTIHRLHFNKNVIIEGAGKRLMCQRMAIDFDDQMRETKAVLAVGDVQLFSSPLPKEDIGNRYEFKAGRMQGVYEQGHLQESELRESVELSIFTPKGEVKGDAEVFFVRLDPVGGFLKEVEMPVWGTWSYEGEQRSFSVTGDQGLFDFDQNGELASSESKGFVSFKLDNYSGEGDTLSYQPASNKALISGMGSRIRKKGQLFHSKTIEVNTTLNVLKSENGVTSSVTLKKRPPFSAKPVMVRAQTVELEDRQGQIHYTGNVEVSQDKLRLRCQDLIIADQEIVADKDVLLSFQDQSETVLLSGGTIRISGQKEPVIVVENVDKKAQVIMGVNQIVSKKMTLNWNPANQGGIGRILAKDQVRFKGDTYLADSDILDWDLNEEKMCFLGNVIVKKGKDFESKGEEVEIDTRSQKLRILNRSSKRND